MTAQRSRLEELLSPERLRDKWREEERPAGDAAPQPAALPPRHPQLLVDELQALVEQRFAASQSEALRAMLGGLRERVARRFPRAGQPPPAEEQAALAAELEGLLNKIEDLLAALQLRPRG